MTILAQFETHDCRSVRYPRRRLNLQVSGIESAADQSFVAIVHDLSPGGMLIETSAPFSEGDEIQINAPHDEQCKARIVWSQGKYYGCQMRRPVNKAGMSAALLKGSFEPTFPMAAAAETSNVAPPEILVATSREPRGMPLAARIGSILALGLISWVPLYLIGGALAS